MPSCRLSFLLPLLLFLTHIAFAQSTLPASKRREKIAKVIDADTGYPRLSITGKEVKDEHERFAGVAVGYFKNDSLVKISWWANRDGKSPQTMDFYTYNGDLIYIVETYFHYSSAEEAKKKNKQEAVGFTGWYYFKHHQLIDQMSTGHGRTEMDGDFSIDLLKDYHRYSAALIKSYEQR